MGSELTKNILNQNYSRSGIIPKSQMNAMARMINNMKGRNGIDVDVTPYGITVSGQQLVQDAERAHFLVESNVSGTSISYLVRGGYWFRELENGVTLLKLPLQCDSGGWDENYDDTYKSITLSNNTTSHYITLILDDPLEPTTLSVTSSVTAPVYSEETSYLIIAKANAASGVIDQYYSGDYHDMTYNRVDDAPPDILNQSLEIDGTTKRMQLKGFPGGVDTAMVATDLVVFRDKTGGLGGVPKVSFTSKVLDSAHSDDSDHAIIADFSNSSGIALSGWPTTWDHVNDITNKGTDDHPAFWAEVAFRNPDDQSYKTTGDCFSNQFAIQENSAVNYWTNAAAHIESSDFISLETKTNDIDIAAKRNLNESSVIYSSCSTSYTLIQSVGNVTALSGTAYVKIDGDAGVIIDSGSDMVLVAIDDLDVDADKVDIYGSTSLKISAQGGRAILLDADIDLQTGGELQVNGSKGKTGWFDDGTNFRITVTKGLITGMANSSSAGWSSD